MHHTVLIIDDDQDLADALSELLDYEGYQTTVSKDGMAALSQIRITVPDLVICDWQMPVLNAGELLEQLRLSETTARVPFIVMTGHDDLKIDFKPTAILTKPLSIYALMDVISQVINEGKV
jgi:CheY-like chemotaxis protein